MVKLKQQKITQQKSAYTSQSEVSLNFALEYAGRLDGARNDNALVIHCTEYDSTCCCVEGIKGIYFYSYTIHSSIAVPPHRSSR